jgi:hypothetical protein
MENKSVRLDLIVGGKTNNKRVIKITQKAKT